MHAAVLFTALGLTTGTDAAELKSHTVTAWSTYIAATEQRIRTEHTSEQGFAVRSLEDGADRGWGAVRRGDILVAQLETRDPAGSEIDVPQGAVHHWRGSIFIPGVSLDDVFHAANRPLRHQDLQEDVLESRVLEQNPHGSRVFLKLRRKKLVTVHYNTEHEVRYTRHSPMRASSQSVATRIAELTDVGTPQEGERPIGSDRGFCGV